MGLGAGKPGFCTVFLSVSATERYQWRAMGDGLQSDQPWPFTASSHGASQIPDLFTLPSAAFCFPFRTCHEVLHSIWQGCLRETILSGQICARDDKGSRGGEDLPRPWKPSQSAAAVLCSCEPRPAVKGALWPWTRPVTALGISTAWGGFICSHIGLSAHLHMSL